MSAPSAFAVTQAVAALEGARRRVLLDDPDLAADEGAIADALGQATEDVEAMIVGAVRAALVAEQRAAEADEVVERVYQRYHRYKRRAESLRGAVFAALDVLGRNRFECAEFTASIGAGRETCVVTDESVIPEKYWRTKRSVNLSALREDVTNGVVVPGAELRNGAPRLTIRSK